jgi:hypothetical protein
VKVIVVLLALCTSAAQGAQAKGFLDCVQLAHSSERLACFDKYVPRIAIPQQEVRTPQAETAQPPEAADTRPHIKDICRNC